MIKIITELEAASNLLQVALDQYWSACSALQDCCSQRGPIGRLPFELSHRVNSQLLLADSYEAKIKEAKTSISLLRNCCTDIVPINTLPDEILGWIFHLVLDEDPCASLVPDYLNCIDIASHVCSRWRRILISLGILWSHIDLNPSSESFFARAVVYAARAGHTPLDVHITDGSSSWYAQPIDTSNDLVPFLLSIAPRINSLTWEIYKSNESYSSILCACLTNCVPGVLTQLALAKHSAGYQFLEATEDQQITGSQLIDLPKQHLEDLWLRTTILRVEDLYPHWTSKAYYGLTSLRLLSGLQSEISIPEQQLIDILRSSPQLCIFHFNLRITDPLPIDASILPVHLGCLEALVWKSRQFNQLRNFLRLIVPGSKSLKLSIGEVKQPDSVLLSEMKRFFARSKVTKLLIRSRGTQFRVMSTGLLDILPPLEVLALGYFHMLHVTRNSHTDELVPHTTHHSCFQALYLYGCQSHFGELQRIIKKHWIQRLTVQHSSILLGYHPHTGAPVISQEEVNAQLQLRAMCPVTKFVDQGFPCEIEGWYELD